MKTTTLLVAAAAFVPSVYGWGALGHQTVALLAQQYLLPETISAVQEILNDTTPVYMGRIALWADQFRTTPEGKFSSPFHFIDAAGTPPGTCGVAISDCPEEGCVVSAITNYVSCDGPECGWNDRLTEYLVDRLCECRTSPSIRCRGSRPWSLSSTYAVAPSSTVDARNSHSHVHSSSVISRSRCTRRA